MYDSKSTRKQEGEGDFHSTPIFLQRIGEFVQIFRLKWKRKARTNELIYKNK